MRIVVVGEGMIELSRDGAGWHVGHGGDTLNTAIHLARFGRSVACATAVGADPFSEGLRRAWGAEGVDTRLVLIDPMRQAGVYAIDTDARGERSFYYWRSDSAARRLFELDGIDRLLAVAEAAELLCYSLIPLSTRRSSTRGLPWLLGKYG